MKIITRFLLPLLLGISVQPAAAQSQCQVRILTIPSTTSGEITIGSCKNSSDYYDVYQMKNLSAGRRLRFTLTKGTLPNLWLQLQRVDANRLEIIVVVYKSEYSKNSLTMDVEIPITLETYTLIVKTATSFGTGTYTLSVQDIDSSNVAAQIVPIVGHLSGAGGSAFRSDLKLFNASSTTITGRLAFTPRNQASSSSDPSVSFSVAPNAVQFFEDVYLMAYPGGSGAARLTILPDGAAQGLLVDTSTYTANPDGGELGQSPSVLKPTDFSGAGVTLIGLLGKITERTNVFVITGATDTTISWRLRTANGTSSPSFTRTYARDATFQMSAQDLLGTIPQPNSTLEATIQSGSARIALSPVNNVSNQGRWLDFKVKP